MIEPVFPLAPKITYLPFAKTGELIARTSFSFGKECLEGLHDDRDVFVCHLGNVSPNMGRPLTDSALVASSCKTSQCSFRTPSSNRTTSAAIQAAGLPIPVKRPCAMT